MKIRATIFVFTIFAAASIYSIPPKVSSPLLKRKSASSPADLKNLATQKQKELRSSFDEPTTGCYAFLNCIFKHWGNLPPNAFTR